MGLTSNPYFAVLKEERENSADARDHATASGEVLWEGRVDSPPGRWAPAYPMRVKADECFAIKGGRECGASFDETARTAAHLARLLAAVEAEMATRVEAAYREGHKHGRSASNVGSTDGADWLASRARAELEAK